MSPAIPPQLSTAVSVGGGSAPSMPRMRAGTPASSSRATKAAKLEVKVDRQSQLKGLLDRCKTGATRRTGKNRYQEALRKRRNHSERSCIGCWIVNAVTKRRAAPVVIIGEGERLQKPFIAHHRLENICAILQVSSLVHNWFCPKFLFAVRRDCGVRWSGSERLGSRSRYIGALAEYLSAPQFG